jgi:hypothetical protein
VELRFLDIPQSFSGHLGRFGCRVCVTFFPSTNSPFHFLLMLLRGGGLNYHSDLNFFKIFVKITVG